MTISYNWLSEYLPEKVEPEKLSKILTSIGLEVESLEKFESVKGGLKGLITGEVIACEKHENADRLKVTKVNLGENKIVQIVCGASNVAVGQKVIVAPAGTSIFPIGGDPVLMKKASIRGVESEGMICAEDEIGLSTNHDGILVLPDKAVPGKKATEYFKVYEDFLFEIGLTPNRMDAMSHIGVARDVSAWLAQHQRVEAPIKIPSVNAFKVEKKDNGVKINIVNQQDCNRYAGLVISGVDVKESPEWLKNRLMAIGQKPINNIVDITNFVLHETGQPLHAFNLEAIDGNEIIIQNLEEGTVFKTLDDKERKLNSEDLMICSASKPIAMAGVMGGMDSGVDKNSKNIFLESAWFNPETIRKTSIRHGIRSDAAQHFEKGVDISNLIYAAKRAALLIVELGGGKIIGEIKDVYPVQKEKNEVRLKYHYLKKLTGKSYHQDTIKKILQSLDFEIVKEGMDEICVAVPFNKTDIFLPADVVEEIIRIDGLDNIEIPEIISFAYTAADSMGKEKLKAKISNYLIGNGLHEILTNSLTNSKYYKEEKLEKAVKLLNNISIELDILKPSMLEPALESLSYNINRRNKDLLFFEFGKTYATAAVGKYIETEHLSIFLTGNLKAGSWRIKEDPIDFFASKGLMVSLLANLGIEGVQLNSANEELEGLFYQIVKSKKQLGKLVIINESYLRRFDIKQPVFWIDLEVEPLLQLFEQQKIIYKEIPKFPSIQRDLAIVLKKEITFETVKKSIQKINLQKLQAVELFDVFESEKLGLDKKSFAISFTFLDKDKTLTDKEVDEKMQKIVLQLQTQLETEIRN